jgi:hypothetical protein
MRSLAVRPSYILVESSSEMNAAASLVSQASNPFRLWVSGGMAGSR